MGKIEWTTIGPCVWIAIIAFASGQAVQTHFSGEARLYTFVDEGTPMNHGQTLIEVKLPGRVYASKNADGSYPGRFEFNPHWRLDEHGDLFFDGFSAQEAMADGQD